MRSASNREGFPTCNSCSLWSSGRAKKGASGESCIDRHTTGISIAHNHNTLACTKDEENEVLVLASLKARSVQIGKTSVS